MLSGHGRQVRVIPESSNANWKGASLTLQYLTRRISVKGLDERMGLHSRIRQQSGYRAQDRPIGNVIVSIIPVLEQAGAAEREEDNLPTAFTLRLAGLLQFQPRVHLEPRGTSGKVRSLCDLAMRANDGQPPERVHLSGWRSQSSPRSFLQNGEY